jgi:hypothetical protein
MIETKKAVPGMSLEEHVQFALRKEKTRVKRKLFYAILLLATIYIIAIEIYHTVEGWDWIDSVYFTTSTITTVGYGDVTPQTEVGKLVTIPLMFIGIAIGLYAIYSIQEYGKANLGTVASTVGGHIDRLEGEGEHIRGHVGRQIKNIRMIGRKR